MPYKCLRGCRGRETYSDQRVRAAGPPLRAGGDLCGTIAKTPLRTVLLGAYPRVRVRSRLGYCSYQYPRTDMIRSLYKLITAEAHPTNRVEQTLRRLWPRTVALQCGRCNDPHIPRAHMKTGPRVMSGATQLQTPDCEVQVSGLSALCRTTRKLEGDARLRVALGRGGDVRMRGVRRALRPLK